MESKPQESRRRTLLGLPDEILLQIYDDFGPSRQWTRTSESLRHPRVSQPSDLSTLQNSRLVCRRLNVLVSPLLCPVLHVSLSACSVHRLEQLTNNALIARGARGLDINLRYRPVLLTRDIRRYQERVGKILDAAGRTCDYRTEFENYASDDQSDDAIQYRAYLKADHILWQIRCSWRQYVEPDQEASQTEHSAEGDEDADAYDDEQSHEDDEVTKEGVEQDPAEAGATDKIDTMAYQGLLQKAFEYYSAQHAEQTQMLSDGSFVARLTELLSRFNLPPFVWFNDEKDKRDHDFATEPMKLADDMNYLSGRMQEAEGWLDIEGLAKEPANEESLLLPARVLTELPIACHEAGIALRGLSIGCFPLTKAFGCLLPSEHTNNDWSSLKTACQGLEIVHFGARGMNCTPYRPVRMPASDAAMVDAYIGALSSGSRLETLCLYMGNLRACDGRRPGKPDQHHRGHAILNGLSSTTLRKIVLMYLDLHGADLESFVERISDSSFQDIYLCGITLVQGKYAVAMETLRKKVASQKDKPKILFSTLQGAEFGAPTKFDDEDNMWMYSRDEDAGEKFFDRLEEYQHPASLQLVQRWVEDAHTKELNPLLIGPSKTSHEEGGWLD